MSQSDLDRNQPATPYKLEKARERGQVAKSADVISAIVFTAAMVFLTSQGWATWREQFRFDQALLASAGRIELDMAVVAPLLAQVLQFTLLQAVPFFATLLVAAIFSNLIQTGPVLSLHPLKPDWNRLNPIAGFKRMFSLRMLFLALRALLKLAFLTAVAYAAIKALLPQFYRLAGLSPVGVVRTMLDDFSSLGLQLSAMLAFIALLDLLYSRREFAKTMRMSHRDMKDESKNREGDPRIRARLRELRRETLKRSLALRNTGSADVLITNPTHVAVALRYVHGEMTSPEMVAKGKGLMAAAMRQIAARHRIPVVQNPPLARALFAEMTIDQQVPTAHYAAVARIVVWVFAQRDARRAARNNSEQSA
jgi:flagellar biosynthetic protein FlhB